MTLTSFRGLGLGGSWASACFLRLRAPGQVHKWPIAGQLPLYLGFKSLRSVEELPCLFLLAFADQALALIPW